MQKEGGAGKNLSRGTRRGGAGRSSSPIRQTDRLEDLSEASYFLLKQAALLF